MTRRLAVSAAALVCLLLASPLGGGGARAGPARDAWGWAPDPATLRATASSELRDFVERWSVDRAALLRRYSAEHSPERRAAERAFTKAWQTKLETIAFEPL